MKYKIYECLDDENNIYKLLRVENNDIDACYWLNYYIGIGLDAYLEY